MLRFLKHNKVFKLITETRNKGRNLGTRVASSFHEHPTAHLAGNMKELWRNEVCGPMHGPRRGTYKNHKIWPWTLENPGPSSRSWPISRSAHLSVYTLIIKIENFDDVLFYWTYELMKLNKIVSWLFYPPWYPPYWRATWSTNSSSHSSVSLLLDRTWLIEEMNNTMYTFLPLENISSISRFKI